MVSTYELWNARTGNAVGSFPSKAAALEYVRRAIDAHGRDYAERLLLGRESRRGHSEQLAAGAELVDLALTSVRSPAPA
jgi:hypothetical protein